jgi:hypothetical protein
MCKKIFFALMMVIILLIVTRCKKTTESEIPFLDQTENLVGHWSFSGNANDESGRSNNGVVNGATLINDRFGNVNSAYSFDGVDDEITIKVNDGFDEFNDPETEFTLSAWCNPDPGASGFIYSNTTEDGWHDLRFHGLKPSMGIRDTDWTGTIVTASETTTENEWHHFVCTFNNPTMTIFVDGQNQGSKAFEGDILSHGGWENGGVRIGVYYLLDGYYFEGGLDDIRIYNRVLIETEVLELYNEGI